MRYLFFYTAMSRPSIALHKKVMLWKLLTISTSNVHKRTIVCPLSYLLWIKLNEANFLLPVHRRNMVFKGMLQLSDETKTTLDCRFICCSQPCKDFAAAHTLVFTNSNRCRVDKVIARHYLGKLGYHILYIKNSNFIKANHKAIFHYTINNQILKYTELLPYFIVYQEKRLIEPLFVI